MLQQILKRFVWNFVPGMKAEAEVPARRVGVDEAVR
jgi:hypothetical protein